MRLFAGGLTALCACGRIGFVGDAQSGSPTDASDASDGALPIIACAQKRATLSSMSATGASVAWSGQAFGISWRDSSGIRVAEVDPAGTVSAVTTVPSTFSGSGEIMARPGGGYAVSWFDSPGGVGQIGLALLDRGRSIDGWTSNIRDNIAAQAYSVFLPIVPHPSGFGVAQTDSRAGGGNYSVYMSVADAAPAKVGSDLPLEVGTRRILNDFQATASEYIILYSAGASDDLYVGRRSWAGAPVGTDALISIASSNLASMSLADEIGIVWVETNIVKFRRYAYDLTLIGEWSVGAPSLGTVLWPSISRNGANWVITWIETTTTTVFHEYTVTPTGAIVTPYDEPTTGSGETVVRAVVGARIALWTDGSALELRTDCP